ncbi:bifunctional diguanylate cyclase/phosphohydrolase [Fusibacter ferrireducens]|uniref:Diguanylate cyclase n=1 Tax=Fusibacter ferrireducens TaxID=2785058 RepID=A0ABR9ZRX3_9FIRM|nr:diguanylate cyclase [Fusibacter ferrireducens]MBF4693207.1 diguanylate cyclase [Fusibacter ferrireducens]
MNQKNNELLRKKIIGLGESSNRKNYYPELMGTIKKLEKINARNSALLEAIPDLLILRDSEGNFFEYYGELILLNEINQDPIKKMVFEAIFDSKWSDKINQTVEAVLAVSETRSFELEIAKKWFEMRIVPTGKDEVLMIVRDITESKYFFEKLEYMATRDYLTGLYNRSFFEERLLELCESGVQDIGLILFDIDGLKLINDAFGHLTGDHMIKAIAEVIKSHFRDRGIIGRLGGDDFGVILENVDEKILDRLIRDLDLKFKYFYELDKKIKMSVSTGYAMHSETVNKTHLLFAKADRMMYQKKLLKSGSVRNEIVTTMMSALEARDYITEGHAERLEFIALFIGQKLGLPQHQLGSLQLLAKFHDFGKVGIPDHILMKPGPLTADEMAIMKTHCEIGQRIASASTELAHIANLILMHHEHWDGGGYPLGLSGEEIPVECRILSLADAYDAMTNDRPYRQAMKRELVLEEIVRFKGKQFDPVLTDLFLKHITQIELLKSDGGDSN